MIESGQTHPNRQICIGHWCVGVNVLFMGLSVWISAYLNCTILHTHIISASFPLLNTFNHLTPRKGELPAV